MKNLQEVAVAAGLGKCSNCGWQLTTENIANALFDAGVDPNDEATRDKTEAIDRLTLCCPGYSDESGCPGYSAEDREKAAYWYSR